MGRCEELKKNKNIDKTLKNIGNKNETYVITKIDQYFTINRDYSLSDMQLFSNTINFLTLNIFNIMFFSL